MQPGYLLTGCVQSGSNTSRGACGGSLPTMPGGALSSPPTQQEDVDGAEGGACVEDQRGYQGSKPAPPNLAYRPRLRPLTAGSLSSDSCDESSITSKQAQPRRETGCCIRVAGCGCNRQPKSRVEVNLGDARGGGLAHTKLSLPHFSLSQTCYRGLKTSL